MENIKKITNYFLPVIQKYRWYILFSSFIWILGNILTTTVLPLFYKKMIDTAAIQFELGSFQNQPFFVILFSIALLTLFSLLLRRTSDYITSFFLNKLMSDIHNKSFQSIIFQTYRFFSNNFTGVLVSKAGIMARNFREIYFTFFYGFLPLFTNLLITIIILFREDWRISLMFFIVASIFIILSLALSKKESLYQKERAEKESTRSGKMSDIFTNILNVKIFSGTSIEIDNYNESVCRLAQAQKSAWRYADKTRVLKNVVLFIFEIVTLGVSLWLFVEQKISIGTLVLVQAYMVSTAQQIWSLDKMLSSFVQSISESVDAIDVVTAPVTITDTDNPLDSQMSTGNVSLENINFTYPEGDHVFENFSLHIPAGQSVGIVGKSGSGKTTITKLLLRFYDVDGGSIKIDDQDIRDVRQDDLRKAIAYIPQESILFHRSIKENIGYSKIGATDQEIIQAAKFAHADEFIASFEHGYDTKVGERGVKLSGGQRQRVSIARAMLKDQAALLVMDEATSSLDTLSEQYIQDSFEKLMKGRTTIVIAHRLSTIQKMDRIIVLDKGEIVEDGSHAELIARRGYYAGLWNSQTDGFIED